MGQSTTAQSLNLQHLQGGSATKVSFSSSPQKLQFAGNGIYPGSGGSCGTSVGSGACTVALAVVPEATGSFSQPLTVTYEDGKRTRTISLTATGQVYFPPDLELLPATQDIGEVFVRGTATIPLTVRYKKGDVPAIGLAFLGIADDMGFPGGTYPGGGTCETQLDPNTSSCTLNLYITPTRQGRETRTLRLLYRSGNEWVSSQAAFTYNAIPPAELGSTPTTIAFGNVATGLSATRTFTITHVQGQPPATQIRASSPASFGFAGGSYPGTGGTCSDRLEVGASCTVVMDFTPMVRGTYSSNLVLTYFDGVGDSELRVPLEGTTQAALQLSLSSQSPAGSVVTGATATSTLTVTHAGGSAATGLLPSVNHAAFSLSAGTCGGTLTSGSCTYTVTFAPVAAGNISGELGVAFNNGFTNDSTTISITGTAIAAATISSNPQSLDFGEMVTTANWTRNITLTNSSGAAVPANAISITGVTAPFSIASTPPAQLNPGQSAQLTIRAQPTVRGTFASTVTVSYFDGARTQTLAVPLSLRALQAATVSIHATSSYDYGYVQAQSQSAPRTFEIRHTAGDVDATVSFSLAYGFQFEGGSFPGTSGTCRSTRVISPGQSCLVAIIFSPPGPGNYGGSFASSMSYSNGASTQYHFPAFAGKSNGRPALGNHDFGSKITGTTTTVSLTVSYQGHTPITNLSARITGGSGAFEFTGGGPYPGIGGNCGAQLSSGSCRISVTFRPQTAGSHSATITLDFESGAGPMSTTASLSGMGSAAALLQVSGNGTATGVQLINSNSDLTFTLSNSTGSVAAISISASPLTAPFSFKGGLYPGSGGNCGSSLAAGSTCRVVLNFRPTSAGVASGQLLLSYFTGATTSQVSQSLSGIGGNAAQLTPSPASIDFGLVMPGQSSTLSVGFANSASAVPATLFRFDALSSPFTLVTHNCPSSGSGLAASSSCEATIRFSPAASGRYSSEIRLTTFDGAVDRTIRIPVAGRTPAEYQISPSDHLDVDERAVGGTHTFTYTLTRIGGPRNLFFLRWFVSRDRWNVHQPSDDRLLHHSSELRPVGTGTFLGNLVGNRRDRRRRCSHQPNA